MASLGFASASSQAIDQMRYLLRDCPTQRAVAAMFAADSDRDGCVSYREFNSALKACGVREAPEHVMRIARSLDGRGAGVVDLYQLRGLLRGSLSSSACSSSAASASATNGAANGTANGVKGGAANGDGGGSGAGAVRAQVGRHTSHSKRSAAPTS